MARDLILAYVIPCTWSRDTELNDDLAEVSDPGYEHNLMKLSARDLLHSLEDADMVVLPVAQEITSAENPDIIDPLTQTLLYYSKEIHVTIDKLLEVLYERVIA